MSDPVAYLITFRTYGTWLHGDVRGSVDRMHNAYDSPMLAQNPALCTAMQTRRNHKVRTLTPVQRRVITETIDQVCGHRGWTLHARQARSNHVHVLVSADATPEQVMGTLKSWCTRRLREEGLIGADARIWSRHGSTKYLWKDRSLHEAGRYVVDSQGEDLA